MLSRILFFIWLLSLFILIYILGFTKPTQIGAVGVLVVFLLFYVVSTITATYFVYIANRIVLQLFFADVVNIKSKSMSLKKAYYFGSVFALGPVMMISLQSVGGVGLWSFVLVCFLLILGSLYVSRQTA
jgi:hypothetical protein